MFQHIPNLISVARLLLVPWFAMLLLDQRFGLALALFAAMAVSDGLDGYLARCLNASSLLGSRLDPLADKVMLVTAFVVLGHLDHIPLWMVIALVVRDVLIAGGSLLQYLLHPDQPSLVLKAGKVNTFLQISLVCSIMGSELIAIPSMLLDGLLWITVLTTLVSGMYYLYVWSRTLGRPREAAQ